MTYIRKLDALPRTDCCGCSCHTRGRYASGIAPGPRPQHGFDEGAYHPLPGADLEVGARGGVALSAAPGQLQLAPNAGWDNDGQVIAELVVRGPSAHKKGQ